MLLNGVNEERIDATDRGLQYGDGVFETIAVVNGEPCLWQRHLKRLRLGCERLGFACPDGSLLLHEARSEIASRLTGVLKIVVTRGAGGRGYRPGSHADPSRILNCSARPEYPKDAAHEGVRAILCSTRLGRNPALGGLKTLNRLEQVLAASEWSDEDIDEGLMCDSEGHLIEGTRSNVFLVRQGNLVTPDLSNCGVAGVMRELVIERAVSRGVRVSVQPISLEELRAAEGVFLTNSIIGIWPVVRIQNWEYELKHQNVDLIRDIMVRGFEF